MTNERYKVVIDTLQSHADNARDRAISDMRLMAAKLLEDVKRLESGDVNRIKCVSAAYFQTVPSIMEALSETRANLDALKIVAWGEKDEG